METTLPFLTPEFLQELMSDFAPQTNLRVIATRPLPMDSSDSILTALTAESQGAPIGHFGVEVDFSRNGRRELRPLALKVKPHAREILAMIQGLCDHCGEPLASAFSKYGHRSGFQFTHIREGEIYARYRPELGPEIFGVKAMPESGAYFILMEHLGDSELLHSVMTPAHWQGLPTQAALHGLARWHGRFLGEKGQPLPEWPDQPSLSYHLEMRPFWEALAEHAFRRHPDLISPARRRQWTAMMEAI